MASDRLPRVFRRPELLALALLCSSATALAAPDPADRALARRLMDDGDRMAETKDFHGALDAYKRADAIMGVPTTGIDVAKTHLALGQLVEAWRVAVTITQYPRKPVEPEAFTRARLDAEALIEQVLPRIPTLRISAVGAFPGAAITVTIDGVKIPAQELSAAQKVNPGEHVIRAASRGRASAQEKATLTEGQTSTLTLTLLPAPEPTAGVPRTLVYTSLGLGAAGILVGSITGIVSLGAVADAKKLCAANGACPPAAQPDLDRSLTMANISNVAFGAGIVFAGLGVAGLVLTPRAATPPSAGAVLVPLSGGAAIRGWF